MRHKPKAMLWLGSSLGNFKRHEVPSFLAGFRDALNPGDSMLIGVDACKDHDRVFRAYNDRDDVTREFTLNGLKHANRIMGENAFNLEDWSAVGEFDAKDGCHRACYSPLKNVVVDGVHIAQGEKIRVEESHKYSREETERLWEESGLVSNTVFSNSAADYGLHLVTKPTFFFPSKAELYAPEPVPSMSEWGKLWAAWDAVTQKMLPEDQLLSKPINLRNVCLFYLGHIPTFLDIHLTRATGEAPTEPGHFQKIFERGIDPDVENPEICHDHSEIPAAWPPLQEILGFQDRVRERLDALYTAGVIESNREVSRAIWLGFEHEAMHLETLLYMLIQSENVLAPPGSLTPDFEALARHSDALAVENKWFTVPETEISAGLDDPESKSDGKRYFGWDNEKPQRTLQVNSFRAKARPVTNGEYATYLEKTARTTVPASWYAYGGDAGKRDGVINGYPNGFHDLAPGITEGKYVRTVYGAVPLHFALNWPVVASYDELASCALWMGGRIPTMEEARSIYSYVEHSTLQKFEESLGNTIPAVNSHLINNGVSETPPSQPLSNGNSSVVAGPQPRDLFLDLGGTNTGFQHWHPISVVEKGDKLCGQSDLGGAWEWTSTTLEKHDGFEAMPLYPGYTADFFDGKHNITLGGSWATHPRIAGRKSFVNWYQRNYPYVWATARIVMDA